MDVGRHSRLAALHLLGCAIAGSADAISCLSLVFMKRRDAASPSYSSTTFAKCFRKAKVGENGSAAPPQDVGWLYVAVNYAVRMKLGDGIAYREKKSRNISIARWKFAWLKEFHREIWAAVRFAVRIELRKRRRLQFREEQIGRAHV